MIDAGCLQNRQDGGDRVTSPMSSPGMCRELQIGFSRAICGTRARIGCGVGGLLVGVAGRSTDERRVGRASAAAFWETPAAAGAAAWVGACSVR